MMGLGIPLCTKKKIINTESWEELKEELQKTLQGQQNQLEGKD